MAASPEDGKRRDHVGPQQGTSAVIGTTFDDQQQLERGREFMSDRCGQLAEGDDGIVRIPADFPTD